MNDQATVPDANFEHARQLIPAAQTVPAIHDPYGRLLGTAQACWMNRSHSVSRSLLEYWRILYKRKWLVLSIVAAFVALNAVRTLMQTPLLYFNGSSADRQQHAQRLWRAATLMHLSKIFEFMQTQYQLLQSRAMADRVASLLKLGKGAVGAA